MANKEMIRIICKSCSNSTDVSIESDSIGKIKAIGCGNANWHIAMSMNNGISNMAAVCPQCKSLTPINISIKRDPIFKDAL